MQLLIPFASAHSQAAIHVLRELELPNLNRLLHALRPMHRDEQDETSLSPPHERALAGAWGWPLTDGQLPFAAHAAAQDGFDTAAGAWGLLTPAHWLAGRDHVTMTDPDALELEEGESRALFEALRPLFESEGFRVEWGAPLRWYAAHPCLDGLPCASLDRVIGRGIDTWLPKTDQGRLLRRLQSETQLTLYTHAINEAREARGALSINSFWLSGCGLRLPVKETSITRVDELRAPLLAGDWAAWAHAWSELDAGRIAALWQAIEDEQSVSLTLCGERSAQRFEATPRTLWQRLSARWQGQAAKTVLEAL